VAVVAFYLAREPQNIAHLACFFEKIIYMVANLKDFALEHSKINFFGPPWDLSCAPLF
jgi:hypothetical protein